MYDAKTDIYICDICGHKSEWNAVDKVHGELWSCEVCGKTFCSKCFIEEHGKRKYCEMMQSGEYIRCPDCFRKAEMDVRKKLNSETLMEALAKSGYPREQMFDHCSDLYIFASPKTKEVIIEWFMRQGLDWTVFAKPFKDQVTGRQMYDIAFQYTPYFEHA